MTTCLLPDYSLHDAVYRRLRKYTGGKVAVLRRAAIRYERPGLVQVNTRMIKLTPSLVARR